MVVDLARTKVTALGEASLPSVSVVIATRDRPEDLARCLPNVLAIDHPSFEVIVVDQSASEFSARIAAEHASDPRLKYVRTTTVGASRGRNEGIAHARSDIVAFTDDDCTVSRDWLERVEGAFREDPRIGVVFGALGPAPHDPLRSFVPTFVPSARRRLSGRFVRVSHAGAGGNMALRRELVDRVGGFDANLGPGGRFQAGDDTEMAYRALRAGFVVLQDPTNVVVHWGLRDYGSGAVRRLLIGYNLGMGAMYGKHIRSGDIVAGFLLVRELAIASVELLRCVVQRRPLGLRRLWSTMAGAVGGAFASKA